MKDILKRVKPEYKQEERIPDTEHLARMRALLVKAHQNEFFIKQLAEGNSYVPANTDPNASKDEMGMSFQDLYAKRNDKIQNDLRKADAKIDKSTVRLGGDGILIQEENPMATSSYASEQDLNSESHEDVPRNDEEEIANIIASEVESKQSLAQFDETKINREKLESAVQNIDFNVALDAALTDLIKSQKSDKSSEDLKEILRNMNKNQYFKMFANSYQRKLNKTLDKHYNEAGKD